MRTKLKELGIGTEVTIYGQYKRVGGNNVILMLNIFNLDTKEYLCDHLWLNKHRVPYTKEHNDFVVVKGIIYEYRKVAGVDYNINPIAICLIKPFVFNDMIVYMISTEKYQDRYWFYASIKGFDSEAEFYDFETDEILHLFTGNNEKKGYEIIEETEDYYSLYYKNRDSKLTVYKTLDKALSCIKIIEQAKNQE